VIEILQIYYEASELNFGRLSPTQIMLTDEGNVKLAMGLYYNFTNESNTIYNLKAPKIK
jgi:hypothetical protein